MPIPLWIPTAIQGAKALYTLFNKPKNQDPGMLIDPINRMISNQESDIQRKTLLNTLTSSAKSMGSRMYQQSQHGLDILKSKGELSEGQYAQGLLQSGSQIQSEVGQQQESALLQQEQRNIQSQDRIDQARMKIAEIKQQYKQANQGMQQQWRNELVGGVLDTAMTGFNAGMQIIQNNQVKGAITGFLASQGVETIAELNGDGLNGLMMTLMAARYGLTVPTGTGTGEVKTEHLPGKYSVREEGNIDTSSLPPITNNDGSISTVDSFSINEEGREVLLPSVVNGKRLTQEEAISHYKQLGKHLGKFLTVKDADNAGKLLSTKEAQRIAKQPPVNNTALPNPNQSQPVNTTLPQIQARINELANAKDWGAEITELIKKRKEIRGW